MPGLGFQLAGIAGGAFAPLIALSLLDNYGSRAVAAYVAGALAFVVIAVAAATRVPLRNRSRSQGRPGDEKGKLRHASRLAGYGRDLPASGAQRPADGLSFVVNFEEGAELWISGGDARNEAVYEVIDRLDILDPCIELAFRIRNAGRLLADRGSVRSLRRQVHAASCGRAVEVSPWLARDAIARGHEVSAHGYRWQSARRHDC